jgi:hypothetical protein
MLLAHMLLRAHANRAAVARLNAEQRCDALLSQVLSLIT